MTITEPPKFYRRFWTSTFGQKVIHVLEPSKWWVLVFALGLLFVNVWALTIQRSQTRDEAAHSAELVANADAQYIQCVESIPILKKINGFIAGNKIIRDTLVTNARAVALSTPKSSPQYKIRQQNWHRLRRARSAAYEVSFPVPIVHPAKPPTGTSCDERRLGLLQQR